MATLKALALSHQRKTDGTYPVKIRVTSNKTSAYIRTPWFAERKDLKGKGSTLEIKNEHLADLCYELVRKYRGICDTVAGIESMSAREVVEAIGFALEREKPWDMDFVAYTRDDIGQLLKKGRDGSAYQRRAMLNSFTEFLGKDSCQISAMNADLLGRWVRWVADRPSRRKAGDKGRAASLYVSQMKAVYNKARKEFNDEDSGIIRIPWYPFSRLEVPKPKPVRKRAIELAELRQLFALHGTLKGMAAFTLDMFMLSFYLIGMNAADLYSCKDYDGKRIVYFRQKTRNRRADGAELSVLVPEEAKPLLEKYRGKGGCVFDLSARYASVVYLNNALKRGMDKLSALTGIQGLQFYSARHTWATLAVNECGIDKYTVHTALNHVDPNMAITDMYIKRSWKPIDDANRKVIDYITKMP